MNGKEAMTLHAAPNLEESAQKNPGVVPSRVRQMRAVVAELRARGVIQAPRYTLTVGLKQAPKNVVSDAGCLCANGYAVSLNRRTP